MHHRTTRPFVRITAATILSALSLGASAAPPTIIAPLAMGQVELQVDGLCAEARRAIDRDDYSAALKLTTQAQTLARRIEDQMLKESVTDLRRRAGALQQEFRAVEPQINKLKAGQEDADSLVAVGIFYAFRKGEWDRGLPFLARGAAGKLKAAATSDLSRPSTQDGMVGAGDLWMLAADEQRDELRKSMHLRARDWYFKALVSSSGPQKSEIEGKLDALELYPDKIVLWNTHNAGHYDRGTLMCKVSLLFRGNVIDSKVLPVVWKKGEQASTVYRPPTRRVDQVRVDVLKWHQVGGGLAEVEVYQGDTNLSLGVAANASGMLDERFPAEAVTDGDRGTPSRYAGVWLLPGDKVGWVQVDLTSAAGE